jgi:hypothetical protein
VATKVGLRTVLMYGFEKKDQAYVKIDDLRVFRKPERVYRGYSEAEMTAIVREESLFEIVGRSHRKGENHGKSV